MGPAVQAPAESDHAVIVIVVILTLILILIAITITIIAETEEKNENPIWPQLIGSFPCMVCSLKSRNSGLRSFNLTKPTTQTLLRRPGRR